MKEAARQDTYGQVSRTMPMDPAQAAQTFKSLFIMKKKFHTQGSRLNNHHLCVCNFLSLIKKV